MSEEMAPMYVRMSKELHDAVQARAAQDDRTMAQTVRHALRYYLLNTRADATP